MTRHQFIFSNQPLHCASRHLLFWTFYFFYFWMQSLSPSGFEDFSNLDTYKFALYSLYCFVPLCILFTYISLYYLLPKFLQRKKYISFFLSIFFLLIGGIFINYFLAEIFVNTTGYKKYSESQFMNILGLSQINIKWAITIALIAMGIKLAKTQYLQKQENLEISRKKTLTELQLQKARVNPALLFDSLDNIYQKINMGSDDAAVMVIKLSDLLSYSLYESDAEMVLLDQELTAIQDFVFLEKASPKNVIEIDINVKGNTSNKYSVPILLPLVQDCINLVNYDKEIIQRLTLDIRVDEDELIVKMLFSPPHSKQSNRANLSAILNKLQHRLSVMNTKNRYNYSIRELEQQKGFILILPLTDFNKVTQSSPSKAQRIFYDRA